MLAVSIWCMLGAYLHMWEPLPSTPSSPWLAYVLVGGLIPAMLPLAVTQGF